jgi:hypothetical protein
MWEEVKGNDTAQWQPEKVLDQLVGVVVEVRKTQNFGMVWDIKKKDNAVITTPCHKVLQERLSEVLPGTVVRITYLGEKDSKKGNKTQLYKVEVYKEDPKQSFFPQVDL